MCVTTASYLSECPTMRIADLADKKVAVYGYGREGRAVIDALRQRLPDLAVTVLDDNPQAVLPTDLPSHSGAAVAAHLADFEVIIKSPGISAYQPAIAAARARGVVFTSSTRLWFAEHPQATTVCITGTKGKSTTASLIAHLLRAQGKQVALGGNIGLPLLSLTENPPPEVWVMELSSYQTSDFEGQPSLRVLLNLFPEHLDWHGDVETYFRDKLRLITASSVGPVLLNRLDSEIMHRLPALPQALYFNDTAGIHVRDDTLYDGQRALFPASHLQLPGAHNLSNLCAALTAVRCLGVDPASCAEAVASFQGLPHRLSVLGERQGLRYVDDSISTTPQSTLAALHAFAHSPVTLLAGGYDRGLDWTAVAQHVLDHPLHALVTMPASGARIFETFQRVLESSTASCEPPQLYQVPHLKAAVVVAQKITPSGGVVLLSPGAPSYGQFTDYQVRGRAFAAAAGVLD